MENLSVFDQAVSHIGTAASWFRALPEDIKKQTEEIRLRTSEPVMLRGAQGLWFPQKDGVCTRCPVSKTIRPTRRDMQEMFRSLCAESVYAHEKEIVNGFLPLPGGHRAGICGTAVYQAGQLTGVRDIIGINLRVARPVTGCAASLFSLLRGDFRRGLLLAGPPGSGKTTLLRDLACRLSGESGCHQVALLDERGELAAVRSGEPGFSLGYGCDIFSGYPKAQGMEIALRVMAPEYIICDELGSEDEIAAVQKGGFAGAGIIGSVHAFSRQDFMSRPLCRRLLQTGVFQHVAFLKSGSARGKIEGIFRKEDLYENHRMCVDPADVGTYRTLSFTPSV